MKKNISLFGAWLFAGCLFYGCTSDDSFEEVKPIRDIRATLNGFIPDEGMTRTKYNISEETGFQTVWAYNDVLGIYPVGGDQVSFPISGGEGSTTACFDGGKWALRDYCDYAAYYPFSKDFYTTSQTAIPVSFLEQTQTGNNTTKHLAAFDFMAAARTCPIDGEVNFTFEHIGCFLRMQLSMPKAGSFTSLSITTDNGTFTTRGTVNLTKETPALTKTAGSKTISLNLDGVSTTDDNRTLTLYMMVAPSNLSGKTLTFTVKDNEGNSFVQTAEGKNMIANYAYNYSMALWSKESGKINGHSYVDLGLPSGTLWATCNIGANRPEEPGFRLAWGDPEPYYTGVYDWRDHSTWSWKPGKENGYCWENYKWCNGSATTITKYNWNQAYDSMVVDFLFELEPEDDAAWQKWGNPWKMPSSNDIQELIDYCDWEYDEEWEVHRAIGPNGNSIALPFSFCIENCDDRMCACCYWATDHDGSGYFANTLKTSVGSIISNASFEPVRNGKPSIFNEYTCRCFGFMVRPVAYSTEAVDW